MLIFFVISVSNNYAQTLDTIKPVPNSEVPDSMSVIVDDTLISPVAATPDSTLIEYIKKDSLKKAKEIDISENAVDEPIPYKARDSIRFKVKEQKVYLYGEASVDYGDIKLTAERIEMDLNTNVVFAYGITDSTGKEIGRPLYKDKKEEFQADTMKYNFRTRKGIVNGVITEQAGGFLHSGTTKMHANDEVHVKDGKYTTCSAEHPHFYIRLTIAKVIPGDKIVTGPANLVVEDVPTPLFLPFGFFPNQDSHKSGIIIPEYGEELNRGFYLRNGGYYWAVNDYVSITLRGDIYTKKSWGASISSVYKKRYKFDGNIDFRYNANFLGDTLNNSAYSLRWSHNQDPKARPKSSFSASVNFGSSSYGKNNANSIDGRLNNTAQSSISYRRSLGKLFNVSTNLNHSQNFRDSTISLKLPVMTLSMNKIYPFKKKGSSGKKWYQKIGVAYNGAFTNNITAKEKDLFAGEAWDQFKNGIKHGVNASTSFNILKYINISPSARYNERWYFKQTRSRWDDSAMVVSGTDTTYGGQIVDTLNKFSRSYDYSVSASMSSKIYGVYQFKQDGLISGMMHVITPNISISYRPDFGEDRFGIYDSISTPGDSLFHANGDFYKIDSNKTLYNKFQGFVYGNSPTGKSGMISMSLNNTLEVKVRNRKDSVANYKKIKLLDELRIGSAYNLAADSLNWSPVKISARTKLFGKLNLRFDCSIDPYAIDTLGYRINTFEANKKNNSRSFIDPSQKFNIGRLTNAALTMSMSFQSKKGDKNKNERTDQLPDDYLDYYVDFEIPWNVRINYNLTYRKVFNRNEQIYDKNITHTVRVSGDFNVTKKWKIGASSGYDIVTKQITPTSIDIYRDLHCWEMSFNWVPFGNYMSYNFTIKAKSSLLQDLKLNKKKSWYDKY